MIFLSSILPESMLSKRAHLTEFHFEKIKKDISHAQVWAPLLWTRLLRDTNRIQGFSSKPSGAMENLNSLRMANGFTSLHGFQASAVLTLALTL
jgi:hypothetical protein